MTNGIYKFPLIAFALSVAAKLVYFFYYNGNEDLDMGVRFAYLLFFLIALVLGVSTWKRQTPRSAFTEDVKTGMKITSVYGLLLALFTWIYYKWINPAYFEDKIKEAIDAAPEESLEQIQQTVELIFSASTHSTITLFGTIVIGFFYVLVITLLLRWQANQLSQE